MIQFKNNSTGLVSNLVSVESASTRKGIKSVKPARDAVRLFDGRSEKKESHLDLSWSPSLRVQASLKKDAMSLKRVAQMLPRDAQNLARPELMHEPSVKENFEVLTQRLIREGVDGAAQFAFEQEAQRLYDRYGADLGIDDTALRETLSNLLKKLKSEISEAAIKPWSPYDRVLSQDAGSLEDRLLEDVARHRQMVMESSGDFSRVLSNLTVEAQSGDEAAVIRLGDFVLRLSDALTAGSALALRENAQSELQTDINQPIRDGSLEKGQAFLELLSTP
ncbi:MAG: hypothetical protein ACPGQS_03340 [Bradymonadia bacterium]